MLNAQVRHILPDPRDAEECLGGCDGKMLAAGRSTCRTGSTALKAWLLVTTRNLAIDYYRRLRRDCTTSLPEDFELMAEELVEPHQSEAEEVIAELVWGNGRAGQRDPFQRPVLRLQTSREIALCCGMEEHTVNVRLSRGRAKLKQAFLPPVEQGGPLMKKIITRSQRWIFLPGK